MTIWTKGLATSITAATLLIMIGCGGTQNTPSVQAHQPHIKKNRALKDWTWEVDAKVRIDNNAGTINTYYYDNIPSKIVHFQVFIDSIPNVGFNGPDGWEVYGADYLIEDGEFYKSQSNTEWKWKHLGSVKVNDNKAAGRDRAISFGSSPLLANAIKGEHINLYIEPYDKNWVGEYFTIPLEDTPVKRDNVQQVVVKNLISSTRREIFRKDGSSWSIYTDVSKYDSKARVISEMVESDNDKLDYVKQYTYKELEDGNYAQYGSQKDGLSSSLNRYDKYNNPYFTNVQYRGGGSYYTKIKNTYKEGRLIKAIGQSKNGNRTIKDYRYNDKGQITKVLLSMGRGIKTWSIGEEIYTYKDAKLSMIVEYDKDKKTKDKKRYTYSNFTLAN